MSTYQRAQSLNPRPDAWYGLGKRQELFEEIRHISALFSVQPAGLPAVSAAVKETIEASGISIDAATVGRIQQCARRVALKASLPEIEDDLAVVGIEAFPRAVAELSDAPADADTWGLVQQRIWNQMWNAARRQQTQRLWRDSERRWHRREISFNTGPRPGDDSNAATLAHWQEEQNAWFVKALRPDVDEATIAVAISKLPERQARIVRAMFWEGQSQADVAAELRVSQGTVSRQLNAACVTLAENFRR